MQLLSWLLGLIASSILVLVTGFFNKSCSSALSVNQLLKSSRVVFTQCFLTVKSDHDLVILGGSFCAAVEAQHSLNPIRL